MPHQLNSLHLRLFLWLLVILVTIWVAAWFDSQRQASDAAAADIDRQLKTSATLLLVTSAHRLAIQQGNVKNNAILPRPGVLQSPATVAPGEPGLPSFQISDATGHIIQQTKNFPAGAREAAPGYQDRTASGRLWRVLTVVDHRSGLTCRVASDQSMRDARAASFNIDFARPLLWLLPALVVGALVSVWRGLVPLRRIEKAISQADLAEPSALGIDPKSVPRELRRLIAVLDELFERLRELLARQRIFTDGAAHELRTPLAGCKTQLEVALKTTSQATRERALQQIQQTVDRMTRLVSQLLLLARTGADPSTLKKQRFDCCQLVRDMCARRRATAKQKNVALRVADEAGRAMLRGDITLIGAMFANILDNAIRFSPPESSVEVRIATIASSIEVAVRDRGPGIDPHEQDYLFERFYRGREAGHAGTGLGLAIVQAVVKAHAGDVWLRRVVGGGTVAVVRLPADPDTARSG